MSGPNHKLSIRTLTQDSFDEEVFLKISVLSRACFKIEGVPEDPNWPSHSLSAWRSKLQLPGSIIIYAMSDDSLDPIGYLFILPKVQPEIGHEILHVWLAGVDAAKRGLKVFPALME